MQGVATSEGKAAFEFAVTGRPYRFEARLKLDGEWRPRLYSNPLYVK